jgi:hypothetical protein
MLPPSEVAWPHAVVFMPGEDGGDYVVETEAALEHQEAVGGAVVGRRALRTNVLLLIVGGAADDQAAVIHAELDRGDRLEVQINPCRLIEPSLVRAVRAAEQRLAVTGGVRPERI